MDTKNDRSSSEERQPAELQSPKKRFQIVKLEERIAPKKGGNGTNNCGGNGSAGSSPPPAASIY